MTQAQLASKLGVGLRTISRWENKKRNPPYTKFIEWANVLDVSIDAITNETAGKEER